MFPSNSSLRIDCKDPKAKEGKLKDKEVYDSLVSPPLMEVASNATPIPQLVVDGSTTTPIS